MANPVRVLIAAHGLRAARLVAATRTAGHSAVAYCTTRDRFAAWVVAADDSVVGEGDSDDAASVIEAAARAGCSVIYPGTLRLSIALQAQPTSPDLRIVGLPSADLVTARMRHQLRRLADEIGIGYDPIRRPMTRAVTLMIARGEGGPVLLGDRDRTLCDHGDIVLSESPAPEVPLMLRAESHAAALRIAIAVKLPRLIDVHLHLDLDDGTFCLADLTWDPALDWDALGTALGIDLPAWYLRSECGETPPWEGKPLRSSNLGTSLCVMRGSDVDDPGHCTGLELPAQAITAIAVGDRIGDLPTALLHLTARGAHRDAVFTTLLEQLRSSRLHGVNSTLSRLHALLTTTAIHEARYAPALAILPPGDLPAIEVIEPGLHSTVQSTAGRSGWWAIGVPPSGPMDDLSLRLANRAVGNAEEAAGIEITFAAASFRFVTDSVIALTGARSAATIDGEIAPWYRAIPVPAGSVLRMGGIGPNGQRCYLAIRGGLVVPERFTSTATFTLGGFGGHAGRSLLRGDAIPVNPAEAPYPTEDIPADEIPDIGRTWNIGVAYGPHGAPDFFTPADIETLFQAEWEVSPQSNRTGVRLLGPKPQWARSDGGEAGLHPSNIHDNAYALGSIDFTGDMPVILGPDGPSLGGFVCPVVVVQGQRWKLGQLRPGDRLRFVNVDTETAKTLRRKPQVPVPAAPRQREILHHSPGDAATPALCCRRAGDDHLLIEYGPLHLDIALRLRVQALHDALVATRESAFIDLTPGIRSLQIHYDPERIREDTVLERVLAADAALGSTAALTVPSRTVHLPLSWDDPSTRKAIEIYMRTVNPDAPWCPWNIEFIRRINGLDSVDEVRRIVFAAEYLVMGLGDVYLGAPVATPVDPRHRLVTTKYNPARTWTPENAVGIGGAYMCIYGMEGPGGYQFVGRTLQVWNTWRQTVDFGAGKPWLLRQFDRISFFPVSAEELLRIREDFPHGRYQIRCEDGIFDLAAHQRFLTEQAADIAAFTQQRDAAFAAERQRWAQTLATSA